MQRSGQALLNVLLFALVTTAFLTVGIRMVVGSLQQGRDAKGDAQVYNVARAGLTHAVSWLQKQPVQPVQVFDPKANLGNPEEEAETAAEEEQLGLVHEFEIDHDRKLWARYEVARSTTAPARGAMADGPHSPLYADPIAWSAEDVSGSRGGRPPGTVWRVRSRAYLFERPLATTPFSPKHVLQHMTLEAEIRRTAMQFREAALYDFLDPHQPAALGGVHVDVHAHGDRTNTELGVADGTGYAIWSASGLVATDHEAWKDGANLMGATLAGSAAVSPKLADQLHDVFGVSDLGKLREMAVHYYEDAIDLPQPQPPMDFIYLKPNGGGITFDGAPQLDGGGVLVVEGNLHLKGDQQLQRWQGLVFVTGHLQVEKACELTGAVICGGTAEIHGYEGKPARVLYSKAVLERVNAMLGTYRVARSTIRVIDGVAPAEALK
ncbi:MAG: hypothetical protein JWM80_1412 [Cyanobacteria bacterium RYN_339]|nr:hypothetical protein [Cyanobacteria bacterium RYN_339]